MKKCDDTNNKLSTEADRIRSEVAKELREKRNQERNEKRRAAHAAELEAQRTRNGGWTDGQLAERKAQAEAAKRREAMLVENGWLIEVLKHVKREPTGFISSMIEYLERKPLYELSPRTASILADIYAKPHGRRGSKAYNAAVDRFTAHARQSASRTVEACGEPVRVQLYDEECVDGWRWTHPDGREWNEVGDWAQPPTHPLLKEFE